MEHGLVGHGVKRAVELGVVLVLELGRLLCPDRVGLVDDVILIGILVLAILPLLLLAEGDFDRHELAVLVQQRADAALL